MCLYNNRYARRGLELGEFGLQGFDLGLQGSCARLGDQAGPTIMHERAKIIESAPIP
jgi:hypothetical protein